MEGCSVLSILTAAAAAAAAATAQQQFISGDAIALNLLNLCSELICQDEWSRAGKILLGKVCPTLELDQNVDNNNNNNNNNSYKEPEAEEIKILSLRSFFFVLIKTYYFNLRKIYIYIYSVPSVFCHFLKPSLFEVDWSRAPTNRWSGGGVCL